MDALMLLVAGMALTWTLGALAILYGADSRDSYGDDHRPPAGT